MDTTTDLAPLHDSVRIVAAPHPLRMDTVEARVPHGLTIAGILGRADLHAHVWLGDREVPRELWSRIRPKPGTQLTVRVLPQGDDILRPILMIGVMAAAIAAPFALGLAPGVLDPGRVLAGDLQPVGESA